MGVKIFDDFLPPAVVLPEPVPLPLSAPEELTTLLLLLALGAEGVRGADEIFSGVKSPPALLELVRLDIGVRELSEDRL